MSSSNNVIDLSKPKYDQETFNGRLKHFLQVTNPLNLFYTKEQIYTSKQRLEEYQLGKRKDIKDIDTLYHDKILVEASIHPDTGKLIPLPLRMASFVPTNLIVTVGLLLPNPTTAGIIFWQWANQSVNVAINWANANQSNPLSFQDTMKAYATAVTASVTLALGLKHGVQKLPLKPTTLKWLLRGVPFASVATASALNVFLMRRHEMIEGIQVSTLNGEVVGKSQIAGKMAIGMVAFSRVLTAFPALLLPPILYSQLEQKAFLKRYPRLGIPIQAGLVAMCLLTALPAAIAVFPQNVQINPNQLETRFHDIVDKDEMKVNKLVFNKGL